MDKERFDFVDETLLNKNKKDINDAYSKLAMYREKKIKINLLISFFIITFANGNKRNRYGKVKGY